jgi:eukaryotic-like serine/threonine-protein kinase
MPPTAADSNLLFAVLALHADLISRDQFVAACSEWCGHKQSSLSAILCDRGWLTPADRDVVSHLVQRQLERHDGDARACLAEVTRHDDRHSLAFIDDADLNQSLAGATPREQEPIVASTCNYVPESRDRYTLSYLHATGGIGRVWLARDATIGRQVALKELRPERATTPDIRARFVKEAQITGQLEHPGIVPIYEIGKHIADNSPFYTMRFVRGRTLKEALTAYHHRLDDGDASPLELRDLLTSFINVCNAVAFAHSRGVLHRDLKPQNVVLGDFGEVVVLDWGMARLIGETGGDAVAVEPVVDEAAATVHGQVLGTPAYMAPEQAEGRSAQLSPRTDVYGLGATLYALLSGRPPFTSTDARDVISQVVTDSPEPPRNLKVGVPPALEAICLKALAKKPEDRYASAKDLADDVRRWMADEPVHAYRDTLPDRIGRWARRRHTFVVAATVFLTVSVIALSTSTALIYAEQQRTQEQRDVARAQRHRADELREMAVAEASRADASYAVTRKLSSKLIDTVEGGLAKLSQAEPVRKELLDALLESSRQLLGQAPDDESLRRVTAKLYRYNANMRRLVGDLGNAERFYLESIKLEKGLIAEAPENTELRSQLAQTLRDYSQVQKMRGRLGESARTLDHSLTIYEELLNSVAQTIENKRGRALTVLDMSEVQELRGQLPEAAQSCERIVAWFQELITAPKEKPVNFDRTFQAAAWTRLASCQRELNNPKEALPIHAQAVQQLKKMLSDKTDIINTAHFLGRALVARSKTLAALPDQRQEAESDLNEAILLWQDLTAKNKLTAVYWVWLGIAQQARGELFMLQERPDAAAEDLDQSRNHLQKMVKSGPNAPEYSAHLARTLAALGRLALTRGESDRAVQWYTQAIEAINIARAQSPDNDADRRSLEQFQAAVGRLKQ